MTTPAERIEEIREFMKIGFPSHDDIQFLLGEIERYRKALEWYADPKNYYTEMTVTKVDPVAKTISVWAGETGEGRQWGYDEGKRAKEALGGDDALPKVSLSFEEYKALGGGE